MKKTITIFSILIALLLLLASNSFAVDNSQTPEEISEVIDTILVDAQKVYEETKEALITNNGENIGGDSNLREATDEGIKFYTNEGQYPELAFERKQIDNVDLNNNNQAIYIKFKPSSRDCICLTMLADSFVQLTTDGNGDLNITIPEYNYNECLADAGFRIEDNKWYHILMAIDSSGLLQGAVWEDGNSDFVQRFNLHIGKTFNDKRFMDQSWFINLGYCEGSELTIENYAYYTFRGFQETGRMLSGEELHSMLHSENEDQILYLNKEYGLYTTLDNPQLLFSEGSTQFAQNNGTGFIGSEALEYNESEGCLELIAEVNPAYISIGKGLDNIDNSTNWAVLVKFQPRDVDNLSFDFVGSTEIPIIFKNDDIYFVDIANSTRTPFSECMPNNFKLKANSEYFILFAIENNTLMRCFVWEEGNYENQAYFEKDMPGCSTETVNNSWQFYISFDKRCQLNIYEYEVYTFENLVDNPEVVPFEYADADTLNNCFNLAKQILNNPQVLYNDSLDRLRETGFSNYSDVDEKHPGNGMEFITGDNTDRITFNNSLFDIVSAERRKDNCSRAVVLWFAASKPLDLQFSLMGNEKIYISFKNNADIVCGIENYPDLAKISTNNTDFHLDEGIEYTALFSMDDFGNIRFYIWQRWNPEEYICCKSGLSELSGGELSADNQNFIFEIVMGNNASFQLLELKVLDFDGYLD